MAGSDPSRTPGEPPAEDAPSRAARTRGLATTAPGHQPEPEGDPRPDAVEAVPPEQRAHPNDPSPAGA